MTEGLGYSSLKLGSPKSNELERKSGQLFIMNKRRQLIPDIKMERRVSGIQKWEGREDGDSYREV